MRYPIAIESGTDRSSFGVVVPDLPGCFSAGDTIDEAIDNTVEAIFAWCESTVESGEAIPPATSVSAHAGKRDFKGWTWAFVDVPVEALMGPSERVNITLPRRVLAAIDSAAKAGGETRSGFIARVAMSAILGRNPPKPAVPMLHESRPGYAAAKSKKAKPRQR